MVQALYGLSMCTIKWSMLFMLKRIFAVRYFKVPSTSIPASSSSPSHRKPPMAHAVNLINR